MKSAYRNYIEDKGFELEKWFNYYAKDNSRGSSVTFNCMDTLWGVVKETNEALRFACFYLNDISEEEMEDMQSNIYEVYNALKKRIFSELS